MARGAFSVGLQQRTVSSLARCEFPEKTGMDPDRWNWIHGEFRGAGPAAPRSPPRRRGWSGLWARKTAAFPPPPVPIELVVPDMAGEAILEEVEHPHAFFVVASLLRDAAAAMVLLDAAALTAGCREPDFAALKILSCLKEHWQQARGHGPQTVAILLTKFDQVENFCGDAESFARAHAPGTWQYCWQQFRDCRFFSAGVAGCCTWHVRGETPRRRPLRIEPHGIVEPFEWLLGRMLA
jgi:hypothetical protein